MSDQPPLLYDVQDHIGVVTLNRPEAMNALNYALYGELEDTVRASDARVLIITGAGRVFCAGDDVKQILGGELPRARDGPRAQPSHRRVDPRRRCAAAH